MAGGTMGVFYGAASLWQWKLTADEPGWGEWCAGAWNWREALKLEGSTYVGLLGQVFNALPMADMVKDIELGRGRQCVGVRGKFAVLYLPEGGGVSVNIDRVATYRLLDPRTGDGVSEGQIKPSAGWGTMMNCEHGRPAVWVLTFPDAYQHAAILL